MGYLLAFLAGAVVALLVARRNPWLNKLVNKGVKKVKELKK